MGLCLGAGEININKISIRLGSSKEGVRLQVVEVERGVLFDLDWCFREKERASGAMG